MGFDAVLDSVGFVVPCLTFEFRSRAAKFLVRLVNISARNPLPRTKFGRFALANFPCRQFRDISVPKDSPSTDRLPEPEVIPPGTTGDGRLTLLAKVPIACKEWETKREI